MVWVAAAACVCLWPLPARAQYRVFDWVNFNDGKLPSNINLGHYATPKMVTPIDLGTAPAPSDALAGIAKLECGPYALSFAPDAKRPHISIMSPLALDRNLLGSAGRALYQADFYLPEKGTPSPTMSLLAAYDANGDRKAYHWYRFGVMPSSNNVFFAYSNNTEKPTIYHQLKIDELKLRRPGWHRFQIVFEGRERILCAIDATPVKFPAISEGTLTRLNAGVFVAHSPATDKQPASSIPAIVDNLSIQYTPSAADFPLSPWTTPDAAQFASNADASVFDPASGLNWMDNPQDAWAVARATKRPLLVLWYVPGSAPFRHLESLVPRDAATRASIQGYVLLRIDVNQLAGGSQAQKFNIVRVPTLMVMTPEGEDARRLTVIQNQTTPEAISELLAGS